MSTIASPRDHPQRRLPSVQTPTSSQRPSIESNRSLTLSPNPNASSSTSTSAGAAATATTTTSSGTATQTAKRNRAALREYYNLKKSGAVSPSLERTTPVLEVTEFDDPHDNGLSYSEVPPSELDRPGFDAAAYVRKTLQTSGLQELLQTYTRVLGEIRALDAEKKGLVYDNYSRLITATETIRKMRATMDPLNPMASTLDPAIAHIYTQAKTLRDAMRAAVPPPDSPAAQAAARRRRTRQLAAAVLQTPARLRQLVRAGRVDEARQAWERPRQLLEAWRDQGLGGADVAACLADGEAALRGKPSPEGWNAEG